MPDIEILSVNRAHRWAAKKGDDPQDHVCATCGRRRAAVVSAVCYVEEVEREASAE